MEFILAMFLTPNGDPLRPALAVGVLQADVNFVAAANDQRTYRLVVGPGGFGRLDSLWTL